VIKMDNQGIRIGKYFKEYKVSNVMAMIKNNAKSPLISEEDCMGKLVVITGATSGIGFTTAIKFASKGADLICINRNQEKSEALKDEIESKYNVKCDFILADLSSMEDTYRVARKLLEIEKPIDILIHNAGIYLTKRQLTPDGIENRIYGKLSFIFHHQLHVERQTQDSGEMQNYSCELGRTPFRSLGNAF
jgi:retinol dehydrogenase 13